MIELLHSPEIKVREQFGLLLNAKGLNRTAVEIGTYQGAFALSLLANWERGVLHCVDPWSNDIDDYENDCIYGTNRNRDYNITLNKLTPFAKRVEYHQKLSSDAIGEFQNASVDFVYIDGNHNRKYVEWDIHNWWLKVRPGGIIAGHDIDGHWTDQVKPVVMGFCEKHTLQPYYVLGDAASWYVHKPKTMIAKDAETSGGAE